MRLPTASSLALAAACPASHALPWTKEVSPAMSRGTAVHRFLERLPEIGRERALAEAPEEVRDLCASIDPEQVPKALGREVAYAWHAETGEVVMLGAGIGRNYAAALLGARDRVDPPALDRDPAQPWIYGTADVVAVGPEVDDYKVTDNAFDEESLLRRPGEAPQLRFLGLCVGRTAEAGAVTVAHLRVGSDGRIWRDSATLSRFDMAVIEDELRALVHAVRAAAAQVDAGSSPDVAPGSHCSRCPAAPRCPATNALSREIGARLAMARHLAEESIEISDPGPVWLWLKRARAFLDLLDEELRRRARIEPIALPGGREVREVEMPKEFLVGSVAYDVARERLGDETARSLIKIGKTDLTKAAGGAKAARALLEEIRGRGGAETRIDKHIREVAVEAPAPTEDA